MTTNRKHSNRQNQVRIACWNIMSWSGREQELIMEANVHNLDICALAETKKKGQGIQKHQNYILIYSGKRKDQRAFSGVGLLIHEKYQNNIENTKYINDRLLKTTLTLGKSLLHIISVYAPDTNRPKDETAAFYEELQAEIDDIPTSDKLIILGDFNARVGNKVINGIQQRFNEDIDNPHGHLLTAFCAENQLRINNTFFSHAWKYKYTWSNTRGQKSVIDYIITNRNIHPCQILDVRVLSSANVGTDHRLLLCKMRLRLPVLKLKEGHTITKLNIESFENESTRELYANRLKDKFQTLEVSEDDSVEICWQKIKQKLLEAAVEALGTRKCKNKRQNLKPWFNDEVKTLTKEKRQLYLLSKSNPTPENCQNYVQARNRVKKRLNQIKKDYWLKYTKDMERDLYGAQKKIWKMLRARKQPINELIQTSKINIEKWEKYFSELYSSNPAHLNEDFINESTHDDDTSITEEEIKSAVKKLKNRKAAGIDEINNELIKYGGEVILNQLKILFNKILTTSKIPSDWKISITVPLFKKGSKTEPGNYRGISLMSCVQKLFTSILRNKLEQMIPISEEQQGFRSNRSTTDAIFMIRQIKEKALEFNKPAFLCFVDLKKAFDRINLNDIIAVLRKNHVPESIVRCINDMNKETKIRVKVDNELSKEIKVGTGVRQGDSLSPFLFNLIMDQIIEAVRNTKVGYRMGFNKISIICYADDAVLIAENEDDLQRLLHRFHLACKIFNMEISVAKTKSLTIAKAPLRCKLALDNDTIEQVMSFRYLGVEISSFSNLYKEVLHQTTKAAAISGCLRDVIWKNKHMSVDSKVRIYKTCVRPIMTYAVETRPDTAKTKAALRTTEMRTLRSITGHTLLDRVRSTDIRTTCQVPDIVRWSRQRRREWNEHVQRMEDNRLAKIVSSNNPRGLRFPGRPPKRWRDSWTSTSQESPNRTGH